MNESRDPDRGHEGDRYTARSTTLHSTVKQGDKRETNLKHIKQLIMLNHSWCNAIFGVLQSCCTAIFSVLILVVMQYLVYHNIGCYAIFGIFNLVVVQYLL